MEQYLIELYDKNYDTIYDEYATFKNEKQAKEYAEYLAKRLNRTDCGISIRRIKDI